MATRTWIGGAPAVKQVDHCTPGSVAAGRTFTVTIGQRAESFTASVGTVPEVTAALKTQCTNSAYPEFSSDIVWTEDGTKLIATANVAGEPFVLSLSATGGASFTRAASVASQGPYHLGDVNNWNTIATPNTLPVTGDTIIFERWATDIRYGLEDLSGQTFARVDFRQTETGGVGLPFNRANGRREYLPRYFKAGMTEINVGNADGLGSGSGLLRLDTGTAQTTLTMYQTGAPSEAGAASLEWKGTHASNLIHLIKGIFGCCRLSGETATIGTLRVDFLSDALNDSLSIIDSGCTLSTLEANSGLIGLRTTPTTIKFRNGRVYVYSGCDLTAVTTIDLADGGPLLLSKAG